MRSLLFGLTLLLIAGTAAAQSAFVGDTLISPRSSFDTFLIDINQNVVQTWTGAFAPAELAYLLDDGSVLRPAGDPNGQFQAGGAGGHIQRIDATNTVVWDYFYSSFDHQQHHDIEPMPNGNVLLIAWERKTLQESINAGRQIFENTEMWPTLVVEIEPAGTNGGNVVWEWHLWDHLVQDADPTKGNFGVIADNPGRLDINYGSILSRSWDHANSIDYDPDLDQIVLSCRGTSEIYIIDHSTTTEEAAGSTGGDSGRGGDFLYRWGNPAVYDRPGARVLFGVHGANWIDKGLPGYGGILCYNNGDRAGTTNDRSSAVEVRPVTDGFGGYLLLPGESYGPATATWTYETDFSFFSRFQGGAFRMPNGNTLITEPDDGRIFEVTAGGTTVWTYLAPGSVHRAPRYWAPDATTVAQLPSRSRLGANSPNPFNPATTIAFEVASAGRVKLEVFDVGGRHVTTLVDADLAAGPNTARWSGIDRTGALVSSGVYFYRLTAPGFVDTRKMILAK